MIPHILVIDKDQDHLSFVTDCINKFGYTSDTASSFKEIAAKMKEERFHIILMLQEIHELDGVKPEYMPALPDRFMEKVNIGATRAYIYWSCEENK